MRSQTLHEEVKAQAKEELERSLYESTRGIKGIPKF